MDEGLPPRVRGPIYMTWERQEGHGVEEHTVVPLLVAKRTLYD